MNSGHAFSPSDSRWAPWRSPFFLSLSPHTSCSTLHGILVPACSHPCSHPSMCWCAWQAMSAAEELLCIVIKLLFCICSLFAVCVFSLCPLYLCQSSSLTRNTQNSWFIYFWYNYLLLDLRHKQRESCTTDLETLTLTLLSGFGLWQRSAGDACLRFS